jgi:predicted CXXCH cytochrome family protein
MNKKNLNTVCRNLKMLLLLLAVITFFVFTSTKSYAGESKEYVGSSTCAMCHEEVGQRFTLTSHYQTIAGDEEDLGGSCESCHGPGSIHADTQDKKDIVRNSPDMCFNCHMGKRAQFQLQYHHPVPEERMACSDCHNLHGTGIETSDAVSLQKQTDRVCFKCHKEMKGPFVFEHDAMREGCQICHEPHGSVYDKLLVADQTNLCLRCHWEPAFNTSSGTLGGVDHNYYIGRGEECVDHHRAPHGSNIWKTLNR